MSSLEEPLGLDKLPSMNTIDRIQRFSSGACRPRIDNLGMGNCWIEGPSCSTSNSCEWVKNCSLRQVYTEAYIVYLISAYVITLPEAYLWCSEDDEEYTAETFPWRRQTRDLSRGDSFSQKTMTMGRNSMKFGANDNSFYSSDYQYSPKSNNISVQDMAYKVMQRLQYFLFKNLFPATKLFIYILVLFIFSCSAFAPSVWSVVLIIFLW